MKTLNIANLHDRKLRALISVNWNRVYNLLPQGFKIILEESFSMCTQFKCFPFYKLNKKKVLFSEKIFEVGWINIIYPDSSLDYIPISHFHTFIILFYRKKTFYFWFIQNTSVTCNLNKTRFCRINIFPIINLHNEKNPIFIK